MREKLKYLEAILLAGSIGLWFMPLVDISILNLSLMDVIKVGIGNYKSTGITGEIYESVQKYLEPYTYGLLIILAVILVGAFLTAVLNGIKAYMAAGVSCILNNIAAIVIFVQIKSKLDEVKNAIGWLDVSHLLKFSYPTIVIWFALYVVILIFAICGILMYRSEEEKPGNEDIFINTPPYTSKNDFESKDYGSDGHVHSNVFADRSGSEKRSFSRQAEETSTVFQDWSRVQSTSAVPPVTPPPIVKPGRNFDEKKKVFKSENKPDSSGKDFFGAILGESGIYDKKAYPLKDTWEVYFDWSGGKAIINENKNESCLAGIYFVPEYQEYCVQPLKTKSFFLESGQPLGVGRHYYIPRGTKIYIKEAGQLFRLA